MYIYVEITKIFNTNIYSADIKLFELTIHYADKS